ncbi:MAG: tetratricopeptide repeat protein [Candidatus Heimdallarchaeota archaeon]
MHNDGALDEAAERLENLLGSVDLQNKSLVDPVLEILSNTALFFIDRGDLDVAGDYIEKIGKIREKSDNKLTSATLTVNEAYYSILRGELDVAFELLTKSLEIFEQLDDHELERTICYNNLANIHQMRGELQEAHDYYQKGISLAKKINDRPLISLYQNNIATLHLLTGAVDEAEQNYKNSLNGLESSENPMELSVVLFNLACLTNLLKSSKESEQFLQQLENINAKEQNHAIDRINRLAKAHVLTSSARLVKRAEAQRTFHQLTTEENISQEYLLMAQKQLCELLLQEFATSGNEKVLSEIKELLKQLSERAERQSLTPLLAEIYLIQSKIALFELDINLARQKLLQTQEISEKQGFKSLEVIVSREFDRIPEIASKWEEFVETGASMAERLELAELEGMVTRLIKQKADRAELQEEEPVLFLILGMSGMSIFSKQFGTDDQLMADQLIGGFITAINAFTQQAFEESRSIEGIKHQEYTLLLKPLESLLCCYAFKGPSYFAMQKLRHFTEAAGISETILKTLTNASNIGIELSENQEISELVSRYLLTSQKDNLPQVMSGFFAQNAIITTGIPVKLLG